MKNQYIPCALLIMAFCLGACKAVNITQTTVSPTLTEISPTAVPPTAISTSSLSLEESAEAVIISLANRDLESLAGFVHPTIGLRFSPYGFIRDDSQVFSPGTLPGLFDSEVVYLWGYYDGSGEPIELTFSAYYKEFVYSADFANAESVAINERLGQGNSINNIQDFFPSSSFVEYHFSGFDAQYEGMDWQSLRLVFIQEDGVWYLAAIVHDEWTI